MKLRKKQKKTSAPMNAMSDVAFLLLVFIMLLALVNFRREVKIEYPEAENARRTGAEKNLEIWIDSGGGFYLDGIPAELSAIENVLGETYRGADGARIHIIADKHTPYGKVHAVVEILKLLEYRTVSFAARDD